MQKIVNNTYVVTEDIESRRTQALQVFDNALLLANEIITRTPIAETVNATNLLLFRLNRDIDTVQLGDDFAHISKTMRRLLDDLYQLRSFTFELPRT